MKNKIAFLLNYAPHYRENIYIKIDTELDADFYFGNIPNSSIKKIEYSKLNNFKKQFFVTKINRFYWFWGSTLLAFKGYKKIVLTGDPYILSNWLLLFLCRLLNIKTYLWTHGWYGKEKTHEKIVKKLYYKLANKIFLYGNYAKELMIEEGFSANKLIVIYNSLDYESQQNIKHSLMKTDLFSEYFNNNYPVLFYIGRVQATKKLEMVIESMNLLNQEGFFTNLVIVGGIDSNYDFSSLVAKYNLEKNVWQVGPLYEEQKIAEYIYNSSVCVSPGNIGLTALHALVYNLPVITHSNYKRQGPEFEAIVEGINGAFFEENNIYDLKLKIKQICESEYNKNEISKTVDESWNPINQITILKKNLL